MKTLTQNEAFVAMFNFLEQYWKATNSDDIAILLGSLAQQNDGMPNDLGMWKEWVACCEKTEQASKL